MQFSLLSVGCWGPGFSNWSELSKLLNNSPFEHQATKSPKPEIIPNTERRRATLPVKLAVESSWQATQAANIDPKTLACVFTSAHGDTDINDYMCRTLNTDDKLVSPTKFHNSVHNAAAGYWTISTACMQSANSTAGDEYSFPLALMEGVLQACTHQQPILLTFYDAPICDVLKPLLINEYAFAASIIIAPQTYDLPANILSNDQTVTNFELSVLDKHCDWPTWHHPQLNTLYNNCPTAKVLALLNAICQAGIPSLSVPISDGTSIKLNIMKQ